MNNNDTRILELKKSIEEKCSAIDGERKFTPATTCIIQIGLAKINLHTLSIDELEFVYAALRAVQAQQRVSLRLCGFKLDEWIGDVDGLITKKQNDELRKQLKASEKKLDTLLSEDKRTELELDAIAALLG